MVLCVLMQGCVEMPPPVDCTSDVACDDGVYCNGDERCVDGVCVAGSEPCAGEPPCAGCDEQLDACVASQCASDADCDDGLFCNGGETCRECVCFAGVQPCDDTQTCDDADDICVDRAELSCSIVIDHPCPEASLIIPLQSEIENSQGMLSYLWTVSTGSLDDPTSAMPTLTIDGSALGSVTIDLMVMDTANTDRGDAVDEANHVSTTTCEATINLYLPGLSISAGADRMLFPNTLDFGGSAPFSQGAVLTSGVSGGNVPAIRVIANRGGLGNDSLTWELIGVPGLARFEDVTLLNADTNMLTYAIAPNPDAMVPTITSGGHVVPVSNIVVPGTYTFRVTYVDEFCGDTASDEVSHAILPVFDILGPGD